eukprot:TRINITY_DN71938_c0_g1_i1.p1 TRINITY_DN71938_c0_g1~~TRINITY_DN71938_c0_g1_i1.p1  ORF type:complete len:383 (+),score=79.03 TRINITY_DN71938_c0_g1_i1:77-1225(+)
MAGGETKGDTAIVTMTGTELDLLPVIGSGTDQKAGSWCEAVTQNWHELEFAPPDVRCDRELVLSVVHRSPDVLRCAAEILRGDPAFVRQVLQVHGLSLEHASEAIRADKELVRVAIKQNARSLRFASEALRSDKELVLEAVRGGHPWVSCGSCALDCAVEELQADRTVVRDALHQVDPAAWKAKVGRDWKRLQGAPDEVRGDKEILMQAVRDSFGLALPLATPTLLADRDLVLEAVRWKGTQLQYAAESLRGDRDIVLEAVRQDWQALEFATEGPRSDREIILEGMKQTGEAFQYASPSLLEDRDLALNAVRLHGDMLKYVEQKLREDPQIAAQAVKENWSALRHVGENLYLEGDLCSNVMNAAYDSGENRRLWLGSSRHSD